MSIEWVSDPDGFGVMAVAPRCVFHLTVSRGLAVAVAGQVWFWSLSIESGDYAAALAYGPLLAEAVSSEGAMEIAKARAEALITAFQEGMAFQEVLEEESVDG